MDIAVTAPKGHVGRFVTAHLVRAGVRPHVLTRQPAAVSDRFGELVVPHKVDLRDADRLADVLRGVGALFLVVPPGGPDPLASYREIGAGVTSALRSSGVQRVVFQSSVGAERRHGAGEIDGLGFVEQQLDRWAADSGHAVTHLRCGYFFTNLLLDPTALETGRMPVLYPPDEPFPWVAPADVASVATSLLLNERWRGRRVQAVHGPEDLSWLEVSSRLRRLGVELAIERVTDDAMRDALSGAGLTPAQVSAILGMSTGLRRPFVPEQRRDAVSTTDTPFEAWAATALP